MQHFFTKLLFAGTGKTANKQLYRRVLFSNVVFLTLSAVYLTFMLMDISSYFRPWSELNFDALTVPLMIAYCLLGIYLNQIGRSYLGRLTFLLSWILLMQVIPIIILQTPADYYIAFPLGLIFHSVLAQLIVATKKEPITFYLLMAGSLVTLIYSKDFLLYFDSDVNRIDNAIIGSKYYDLVIILYWLLFNTMTYYVIRVLDQVIEKNEEQKELLLETNKELNEMNALVDVTNKNLEDQVDQRTKELQQANKVLASYAFYNAHLIKGPFCRIKGLAMLAEKNAISEKEFKERMATSIQELDKAIEEMQLHFNDANKID
ncbi:hypothetical protein E1176_17430 [Fulvivirga sp. RKSG066]|uniref:hypothetical protein n=1 Tax=Fulvivirga aurantia TaxID=2529383 RepID=UPI0012BCD9C7|nr:hypothetical protein [Fulvivirga aurantia]MTI22818.1 hypothetical protein [Fulvivirga aurantia]